MKNFTIRFLLVIKALCAWMPSSTLPQSSHIQETSSLQTMQIDSEVRVLPHILQEPLLYNSNIFRLILYQ
jgi:hypothetical protein